MIDNELFSNGVARLNGAKISVLDDLLSRIVIYKDGKSVEVSYECLSTIVENIKSEKTKNSKETKNIKKQEYQSEEPLKKEEIKEKSNGNTVKKSSKEQYRSFLSKKKN